MYGYFTMNCSTFSPLLIWSAVLPNRLRRRPTQFVAALRIYTTQLGLRGALQPSDY